MRLLVSAFLLLGVGLAACGDDDDAPSITPVPTPATITASVPPPPFDVCGLLTTEEAAAALGKPVADGEPAAQPPAYTCGWDAGSSEGVFIEIAGGTADEREAYFLAVGELEEFDLRGYRAHYDFLLGVEVLARDYVIEVAVLSGDGTIDELRERSIDLAEVVLERVEG